MASQPPGLSMILELPPELLSHVFSLLSGTRANIASCRLVCNTFKELSSPFLITTVVFAKRIKVIKRVIELLDHPYFSRHVTELLYDASSYDQEIAYQWDDYVEACESGERVFHDEEWIARQKEDSESFRSLRAYGGSLEAMVGSNDGDGDISVPYGDDDDDNMESYYHKVYRLGCHRGLPDYQALYRAQARIESGHVLYLLLARVFTDFPNLRRVVYGDFRLTAFPGESFDGCCRRLFGNTLQPKQDELALDLRRLLRAILLAPPTRINSFAVGPHLFEASHDYYLQDVAANHELYETGARFPTVLPRDRGVSMDEAAFGALRQMCGTLRHLRLPIDVQSEYRPALRKTLEASSHSLTNLSVSAWDFRPFFNNATPDGTALVDDVSRDCFVEVIAGVRFEVLSMLDLRGFVLAQDTFCSFLEIHKTTLRELHLVENVIEGKSEQLANWGRRNLILSGVLISNRPDVPASYNEGVSRKKQRKKSKKKASSNPTPGQLEALWLDGRHNHLARVVNPGPSVYNNRDGTDPAADGPWWTKPCYWRFP